MEVADLWVRLRSINGQFNESMRTSAKESESFATRTTNAMAKAGKATALAGVAVTIASVKMAADFQSSMLRLKTSAAETGDLVGGKLTGNLKLVSDAILKMSVDTATGTKELADGMYMIESAGMHGAEGIKVLRAAAEGAKAEGAPLHEVGAALTTLMKDFHQFKGKPVEAMNALISTVAHGKTTMGELASSLHSVLPIAASAGLSYAEIGGAIATMTSHGVTAHLATQHLANTIRNLMNPSMVSRKALGGLGLSANELSHDLGKNGLSGTMDILLKAIAKHSGKDGMVLLNTFNTSKDAASGLKAQLDHLPPSIQGIAKQFQTGKISSGEWKDAIGKLDDGGKNLAKQFQNTVHKVNGFNQQLKNGGPASQTFMATLAKATGGAVSLETALQLSGIDTKSTGELKDNIKAIGDGAKTGGAHVENWKQIQGSFNFQMTQFTNAIKAAAISYGTQLLPALTKTFSWLSKHQGVVHTLVGLIGGLLAASFVVFAAKSVMAIGKPIVGLAKLGVAGVKAGGRIVQGFRSAQVAGSAFSGKAGTLGGKLRTMWNAGVSGAKRAGGALAKAGRMAASGAANAGRGAVKVARLGASYVVAGAKATGSALARAGQVAAGAAQACGRAALAVGRLGAAYALTGLRAVGAAAKTVAFKVVQLTIAAATKAWAAAQWILNAALDANPIGLIVIAIAALVGGFILAYNKVGWFRSAVDACMKGIGVAVGWVVGFVKAHWKLLVAIFLGPIGIVIALVAAFGPKIKSFIARAVKGVLDKLHALSDLGDRAAAWFRGLYDAAVRWFRRVLDWCGKLPHQIYLKLIALGKLMSQVGHNLINGLIKGINDGASWLYDKIKNLASSAVDAFKSAFDINSPSKATMKVGHSVGEGLAEGIERSTPKSVAAAKRHAAAVKKQMETLHKQLVSFFKKENLAAGLAGASDKIKETIKKLNTEVLYAWRRGGISTSKASHLLTLIRDDNTKLQGLAKARQKILDTIAAAKAFRDSTRDNAIGFASITGLGETSSSTDMLGKMRDKLFALKDFAKNISKLAKAGLNKTSLRQLIEAGPEAAAQMAGELANGPATILNSINDTQSQINAVADQLGTTGANALYGKTANLQSQADAITKLMKHAADQLVKALEHALGVKSKGKGKLAEASSGHLVHGHGKAISKGAALKHGGGAHGAYRVHAAPGADRPLEVHVILDGKQIHASVQKHTLRTAKRNPTNGLTPR